MNVLPALLLIAQPALSLSHARPEQGVPAPGAAGRAALPVPAADAPRVEAACGQCRLGLPGRGSDLAMRARGRTYFVAETGTDGRGDVHARTAFATPCAKRGCSTRWWTASSTSSISSSYPPLRRRGRKPTATPGWVVGGGEVAERVSSRPSFGGLDTINLNGF